MNIIEMNDDYRYDIDLSKAGIKVDDNNLFSTKEKSSVDALNKVLSTTVELKSNDNAIYNLFIEFDCTKRDGITYPSGIATTEAHIWRVNVGELVYEFPTHFLKWLYLKRKELNIKDSPIVNVTDLQVTGMLVPASDILNLYHQYRKSEEYRKYRIKNLNLWK